MKYISFDGNSLINCTRQLPAGNYFLDIAVFSLYRLKVNSVLQCCGPARAPHGYARCDRIKLAVSEPVNLLEIEVLYYDKAGRSLYLPSQRGFAYFKLEDENGDVITETDGFTVNAGHHRDFAVEEFTDQRHLMEFYDQTRVFQSRWQLHDDNDLPEFLDRGTPLPEPYKILPSKIILRKELTAPQQIIHSSRPAEELAAFSWNGKDGDGFILYDFSRIVTGFFRQSFYASGECELLLGFDELPDEKNFPGSRQWWGNFFCRIKLKKGEKFDFESFEPYTCRYVALWVISGPIPQISPLTVREYAFPEKYLHIPPAVAASPVGRAAVETFRQNTLDLFMDCPGRERAAWLCDSFFTARTAYLFTGNTDIEEVFLENFLLPESFANLPSGMLPMCYPADTTGTFIPQWAMWFVLQVDEYRYIRNGKRDFANEFKERFLKWHEFFRKYTNADGLLENLPGWNLMEWSAANDFISGIHYPTNLLYSECLMRLYKWYGLPEMRDEAEHIRFIIANGITADGRMPDNPAHPVASETAQYFAWFFGGEELRKKLSMNITAHEEFPCGLFIGKFLRFNYLLDSGQHAVLAGEIDEVLRPMAEKTGTLWEKFTDDGSCCHGFASYAAVLLDSLA